VIRLAICLVLPLAALPVYAEPPTQVSGDFDHLPTIVAERTSGGNWIVDATDVEWWTGDLVGTATSEYKIVFHRSGVVTFSSKGEFTGSVLGSEEGTLQYQLTGVLQPGATSWQGSWWMGQGTGGLEGAHAGEHGGVPAGPTPVPCARTKARYTLRPKKTAAARAMHWDQGMTHLRK
jgi:hypothetical protein